MERKVGEVFNDGNDVLKVVESTNCIDCHYKEKKCSGFDNIRYLTAGYCVWTDRDDETPVKFIKIEETKMDNKEELLKQIAEIEQREKENQKKLNEMKKQLEELNKKEVEVSATGVWLGQVYKKYYYSIADNNKIFQGQDVISSVFDGAARDSERISVNNCFATREQAEQEALRREGQEFIRRCAMLWNKDHDWRKEESKTEWYIEYSISNKKLTTHSWCNLTSGIIFFDTQDFAEKCIEELKKKYNEEQIKTIFGVK